VNNDQQKGFKKMAGKWGKKGKCGNGRKAADSPLDRPSVFISGPFQYFVAEIFRKRTFLPVSVGRPGTRR
jgi:hypothetical protein